MSAIEDKVCEKIQNRAKLGLRKYNATLERTDLTTLDWLIHAQEEAMDLCGYLEVLISTRKSNLEQLTFSKFKVGDKVVKVGGDYTFEGIIRAAFPKGSGVIRYVVEDDRGVLHIYSDKVLKSSNEQTITE